MAENVPGTPGFWQRFGAGLRAAPAGFAGGLRDYARRNFTREGWQEQLEGNPLQDATAVGRAASTALGGPPAIVTQFANSGLRGLGRGFMEAYRNAGLQNPGPTYGDMSPVRGSVSVGDINTDGSGTPYAIDPVTGVTYQNSYPGITGPYTGQQPANTLPPAWTGVNLPYLQPESPRNTTGLPGITSPLAGSGYGPTPNTVGNGGARDNFTGRSGTTDVGGALAALSAFGNVGSPDGDRRASRADIGNSALRRSVREQLLADPTNQAALNLRAQMIASRDRGR